jgi:hypothetical protein
LWDINQTRLQGYFEVVRDLRNAGAVDSGG